MGVDCVPYEPRHMTRFSPYRETDYPLLQELVDIYQAPPVDAVTFLAGGLPVMVGGCLTLSPGRGAVFAVMGEDAGPRMLGITRRARLCIDRWPHHRLELDTQPEDARANRWAEMLGFTWEGVRRAFYPDRSDAIMWVKVR